MLIKQKNQRKFDPPKNQIKSKIFFNLIKTSLFCAERRTRQSRGTVSCWTSPYLIFVWVRDWADESERSDNNYFIIEIISVLLGCPATLLPIGFPAWPLPHFPLLCQVTQLHFSITFCFLSWEAFYNSFHNQRFFILSLSSLPSPPPSLSAWLHFTGNFTFSLHLLSSHHSSRQQLIVNSAHGGKVINLYVLKTITNEKIVFNCTFLLLEWMNEWVKILLLTKLKDYVNSARSIDLVQLIRIFSKILILRQNNIWHYYVGHENMFVFIFLLLIATSKFG